MTLPDLSAFGEARLLMPLAGGHRNAVWLGEVAGQKVVFKSTRRTEAQLRWLADVQQSARRAGFVVPSLTQTADGHLQSRGWTAEPFLEGRPFAATDMAGLAARTAEFHRLSAPLPQRPGFLSLPALAKADIGGDIDLRQLPDALSQAIRTAWHRVADAPCQCLHGDLGPQNLIHTADGPALIDWDEARVDCLFLEQTGPLTDAQHAAHLGYEIASGWKTEPDYARKLAATFIPVVSGSLPES